MVEETAAGCQESSRAPKESTDEDYDTDLDVVGNNYLAVMCFLSSHVTDVKCQAFTYSRPRHHDY